MNVDGSKGGQQAEIVSSTLSKRQSIIYVPGKSEVPCAQINFGGNLVNQDLTA